MTSSPGCIFGKYIEFFSLWISVLSAVLENSGRGEVLSALIIQREVRRLIPSELNVSAFASVFRDSLLNPVFIQRSCMFL